MVRGLSENLGQNWRGEAIGAVRTFAVMVAVLVLDGQLGPLSFTLRRAITLAILAAIAVPSFVRGGRWRIVQSTGEVAALILLARAPSVSISLVGFLVALAAIGARASPNARAMRLTTVVLPACLLYVGFRFAADLVPQIAAITEAVPRWARAYANRVRGSDERLSFAALGGPAVGLAMLYLLWGWRLARRFGRIIAASVIPLGWFALLPAVTPDVAAGPIAAFARGAWHGVFWLAVAVVIDAVGLRRPVAVVSRTRERRAVAPSRPWLPLTATCLAATLAGVCLVGTGLIGPAPRRPIRVHNFGGLDWDRPVYGEFGAFAGGMFGLLPVYCRAEGYDFDVIDHSQETVSGKMPLSHSASNAAPRTDSASITARADSPSISTDGLGGAVPVGGPPRGSPALIPAIIGSAGAAVPHAAPSAKAASRPKDAIEPADLDKNQILVLINSPKLWDDGQRRVVLDFVARGGSLLVLGDHTDVFGLMRGFNSLIGPLGIKFRFDSAYQARQTWRGCQAVPPDGVASGWDDHNPGVAVGASLELIGNARPLLVGRYAFSDAGIRENVMGSFLGNYHYDKGERLGDVVLVATVTHGKGRIVVWGDTSAFQGGLSTHYRTVVGPMLAWLSRPAAWTEQPLGRIAAAVGLLAALLWCWIVAAPPKQIAAIAVSLLIGLAIPWTLSLPNLDARPHVDRDTVLIDGSHMGATGHYEARVNSIGPLYTNLLRSGFRVLDMDRWDSVAIGRARGIAFVAPQKSITRGEVNELLRAEENGAIVILTTGQPDSAGSRLLLEAHGLALAPRPVGTVTPAEPTAIRRERERQPRLLDAWPIVAVDEGDPARLSGVDVIYRQGDDVVALFRRVGQGGFLVISDTRFFSDMNVEDMSGYWIGNLALNHDLFKRYLGADPEAVKPLFRSPEKPR